MWWTRTNSFGSLVALTALGLAAVVVGWHGLSAGEEQKTPAALPADLDLVSPEATGFVTIRVSELWSHPALKVVWEHLAKEEPQAIQMMEKALGVEPPDVERLTFVMPTVPAPNRWRQQGMVVSVAVATSKPYDKAKVVQALLPSDPREQTHKGKTIHTSGPISLYFVNDRTFLMSLTREVEETIDRGGKRGDKGPLSPALAVAAGKHQVVGGLNIAPFRQFAAQLPPDADPYKPLLEADLLTGTLDLGDEIKLDARLAFREEDQAKAGEKAIKMALDLARAALPEAGKVFAKEAAGSEKLLEQYKALEAAVMALPVKQQGSAVEASLHVKTDPATAGVAWVEAVGRVRQAAMRAQSANNLKQIALALHSYHDVYGAFPPQALSKDGKPVLSWRVAILPFVEQDQLYKQFNLDEPWDGPNNKKLLDRMPKVYAPVRGQTKEKNATFYQVFVGKGAAFEGEKGLNFASFTDGTSNTLLAVEAGEAVPWTKPDDLPYDAKKPLPKLGGLFPGGFNAAFADGSIRFFKKDLDEKTLRALITRNGGEVVKIPD